MLTHLEFEQIKRAIERLQSPEANSGYNVDVQNVKRRDVLDLLLPYVDGFLPPNPHPVLEKPLAAPAT